MTQVTLPKLGESIVSATVVQWLKKVGENVALDEPLLEVSTDKVNSEIPSPVAGILQEILVQEGVEIEVGAPLAVVGAGIPCALTAREESFSPAVLRTAEESGLSIETLRHMQGTGEGGRVTKKDLEAFVQKREQPSCSMEERVPMTGMRKAIAENMVRSFYAAPHASFITEVDVTEPMKWVAAQRESFLQTHGVKLTITTFILQALAQSLQQFPMLNASLEGETIVCKKYINIGIAVNIDHGLIVPVIKNCQERTLISLAKALAEVAQQARQHQLTPDAVQGGTMTLTNFGMTGTLMGVPIIRHPEVAIMGVGAVQKRLVVRDDDTFAVRQMLYISLTFDHRVVDGVYVCDFLSLFKRLLEATVDY